MVFLSISYEKFWRQIVGCTDDSPILGHIAHPDSSTRSNITHFEEQRILLEDQYITWFDIPMS